MHFHTICRRRPKHPLPHFWHTEPWTAVRLARPPVLFRDALPITTFERRLPHPHAHPPAPAPQAQANVVHGHVLPPPNDQGRQWHRKQDRAMPPRTKNPHPNMPRTRLTQGARWRFRRQCPFPMRPARRPFRHVLEKVVPTFRHLSPIASAVHATRVCRKGKEGVFLDVEAVGKGAGQLHRIHSKGALPLQLIEYRAMQSVERIHRFCLQIRRLPTHTTARTNREHILMRTCGRSSLKNQQPPLAKQ